MTDHRIDRRRVWHDGLNFRCSCARCSKAMLRKQDGWQEFKLDQDTDLRREGHPRTGEMTS